MSGVALWIGVALLGGCGAVLRFLVDEVVRNRVVGFGPRSAGARTAFPLGIFVVNVSGAFAAGVLVGASLGEDAALLALTAFVGAYTTFSTWMLDAVNAANARLLGVAAANIGLSLVVGFAAAAAGHALGAAL